MAQKEISGLTDKIIGVVIGGAILLVAWDALKPEPPIEPQLTVMCACPGQDSSVTIGPDARIESGEPVADYYTCMCWKDNMLWGCEGPKCGEFAIEAWHPNARVD